MIAATKRMDSVSRDRPDECLTRPPFSDDGVLVTDLFSDPAAGRKGLRYDNYL